MSTPEYTTSAPGFDRPRTSYHVMRHLIDNALVDRDHQPMGNVDDLTIELSDDAAPRITHVEAGGTAMTRGLAWPLGALLSALARRWGAQRGEPLRIPWSAVLDVGVDVQVDVVAEETPALHWERVLRERIVRFIPGSRA